MNIRKAKERDIAGINALLYQVHRIHAEGRPDIFRLGNKKYNDDELRAIIADDNAPIFVAVDDAENVLGYAFCIYQEVKDNASLCDRKTVYIDDLCVDATLRGQHIGTALYEHVLATSKQAGCQAVTLNVWCLNEGAMRFYEKLGMKPLKVVMEETL